MLATLLPDPGGREILAEVGVFPSPCAPVLTAEIETVDTIADRIEPTGVRHPAPQRAVGEMIDPMLPLESVIANAESEISNAEVPWPGFEQATFSLLGTIEAFSGGRTTLDCETTVKNLVFVTKQAVAGAAAAGAISEQERRAFVQDVDDAATAILSSIEANHCLNRNAQKTLADRTDEFVTTMALPGGYVIGAVLDFLASLLNLAVDGEGDGEQDKDDDGGAEDARLDRIEQLRDEVDLIPENALSSTPTVERNIEAALPSRRRASCGELLVSLGELG